MTHCKRIQLIHIVARSNWPVKGQEPLYESIGTNTQTKERNGSLGFGLIRFY